MSKILCIYVDKKIQTSHPIKTIEPKQPDAGLSSDNLLPPSTNGFHTLHRIVLYSARQSRSLSPNHKIRGSNPNTTFQILHREFGKLVIKDRNERLRLYKSIKKSLYT